jgi:hypothetical protein
MTEVTRRRVIQDAIASGRKYSKLSRSPDVTDESSGVRYAKAIEKLRDLGVNVRRK